MRWLRVAAMRVRGLIGSDHDDRELDDELETVVQLHVDDYVRSGLTAQEARRQALIRIGGLQSVKQAHRERRGIPIIETALQDVRFGARMLLRHRSYSVVAIFALALGIGATTAMFGIVDSVMLRPFPFPDATRLVMIWETNAQRAIDTSTGSAANYVDWRAGATTFTDLGAWEIRHDNRTDGPQPARVQGAVASAQFFRVLGMTPQVGRFFRDDEDTPAGRFVAVLGYEYWQREFFGDDGVLGRTLTVNGEHYTVVGVAPPLRAPFRADIWRPLAASLDALDRGDHSILVIGRLAPGNTMRSAEAELQTIAGRLADRYAESNRGWSVRVEPIYDALVPDRTRRSMWTLLAAVGLLLLISCVNVASLTLARATARVRELATRSVLGAGRTRLVRQLFTESVLIAAGSATLGMVMAMWMLDSVQWLYPADIPGLAEAELDPYAVAFAIAVGSATTILVGLLPALQVSGQWSQVQFLTTRSATSGPQVRRLRHTFVVAQVALAVALLVVSGLLLASVNRLMNVPLGFGPDRVVTAKVGLYEPRFEGLTAYTSFLERVLNELEARPGVAAAGISSSVPFDGGYTIMAVRKEADRTNPDAESILTQWRVIGGDYLDVLEIPVTGRTFTADDNATVPRVTIINDALARQVFGDQDPIGRHVIVGDARRPWRVIGVARAARLTALDKSPEPTMYFHYRQFSWRTVALVARAAGDPAALSGTIRAAVAAVDPTQPVFDEHRMSAVVDAAAASPRMNAALLSTFAVLALALAAIGVYGVMSYTAAQRRPEISLRLALGARPASVFLLVCRTGLRLTAWGLGLGVTGAFVGAAALGSLLFEVSTLQPEIYVAAVSIVLVLAMAACGIPARRAMRSNPNLILRQD